jgi:hypothetical protein
MNARRNNIVFRGHACHACAGVALFLACASHALAATQEEVFKSINRNVESTVDMHKALPYLIAGVAVVILLGLWSQRGQRQARVRVVNHSGKLARRMARKLHLRKVELKQLKILAQEQQIENSLTLLLCPSILAKAMRTNNPRLDRKVLMQVVQRLRREG